MSWLPSPDGFCRPNGNLKCVFQIYNCNSPDSTTLFTFKIIRSQNCIKTFLEGGGGYFPPLYTYTFVSEIAYLGLRSFFSITQPGLTC